MQKVIINGKEHGIVLNLGVIKYTCKELKITVPEMMKKLSETDLEVVSEVLYQGIKFNSKEFDRAEIDCLSFTEMFKAFEVVGELLQDSMPQADSKKKIAQKKE